MYKIAIFASGSGTNAENIANHFAGSDIARVSLVLTNVRDAGVVGRMQPLGIDTYYVPNSEWRERPESIASFLERENIDLVVLAGFMRKVDDVIVDRYRGRMLNIHPSLLPAYGGKGMYGHHVHEAVIAAGETRSGVTVHQVSEVMDAGDIVAQQSVEITSADDAASLEAKIHEVEYELYPRAIEQVLARIAASEKASSENERSVTDQWASALGMGHDGQGVRDAEVTQTPPPMPGQPPVYKSSHQETYVAEEHHEQNAGCGELPAMPSTYLLWSVLSLVFCCTVLGIVATVFSCQVSSKYYNGDYEGAEKASRRAQAWIIASFCVGVIQATVFTPLYMIMM